MKDRNLHREAFRDDDAPHRAPTFTALCLWLFLAGLLLLGALWYAVQRGVMT